MADPPRTGDTFRFLEVDGSINGQFAQVVFPQLLPGFQFDTAVVPGGLQVTALNNAVLKHRALNISTRMRVETGDDVLIGGFILTGNDAKKVILRAIGPSLAGAGLAGFLQDPTLELYDSTGAMIASNDNWRTGGQEAEIIASTIPPTNDLESAIVRTLPVGGYTAIVRGNSGESGIGLVEAYDVDPNVDSKLANISSRGRVQTNDDVMIGGFIVGGGGGGTMKVIVRAIGPSLPVSGALADPTLELFSANGMVIASNDNWRSNQEAEIIASTVPPTNDLESAIVATLPAAAHTAIVRGKNGTTGVALVEVYALP